MAKKNKKSRGGGQQFLFYRLRMDDWEFDEFLDDRRDTFRECSYEEAHNRVWGSIAYAEEAGIRPDKSFLLTQYMLEEDTDDIPLIEYEYGKDGKHFLTRELGWDDHYARRICFDLWYKANHADDPSNDDDETIEEYFDNEALSLDDITEEERRKGRRLLADYVAHIPRWTLKGHAPAERQTP